MHSDKSTVNLEILVEKIFSVLEVTDMLVIEIGSSLKIFNDIHAARLLSSNDVEPVPFTLPYLQKSSLVSHKKR